ncbi:MAG: HsdM family class I SAM-dependent methyltransferase [Promethearchaeota archaeon]
MDTKIQMNTINAKVLEIIQEANFFKIQLFEGVKLPSEQSMGLDFTFIAQKVCGEGEWENSVFTGYNRVYNFLKSTDAQSVFLIIYPDFLKRWKSFPKDKLRKVKVKFCFIRKNGGSYIKSHLVEDIPQVLKMNIEESVEDIDLRIIIDTMHQAVTLLKKTIDSAKMDNIFLNELFAEENVDENISITSAAYLLLNQLIFYRIITSSEKYRSKLDTIEPYHIDQSRDLDEIYFAKLNTVTQDYNVIYNTQLSSFVKDVEIIRQIISFVNSLAPERIKGDFLGKVFHQLIPKKIRKKVASYYTLEESAYLLAKLTITNSEQFVCDPSCGSGTLLCAAYQRKKELLEQSRKFVKSDHNEYVTNQLFGADIMPFAAHLAVIHLALQDINNFTNTAQITVMDSNTLKVGRELSMHPDVFLINPPFTKKQRLAIQPISASNLAYRDKIKEYYSNYFSKNILTNKSPFYAYFICLSDRLLGTNSEVQKSIGAVLPAIILRNRNEKLLRQFLLANYWIRFIIVREDKCNFSEDTSLREILLVLTKRTNLKEKEDRAVQYVFIHDFNNFKRITDTLDSRSAQLAIPSHEVFKLNDLHFSILNIPQEELTSQNLFYPISIFSFNYDFLHIWLKIREKKPFRIIKNIENIQIKTKNAPEPSKSNLSFRDTSILLEKYKKDNKDMILVEKRNAKEQDHFEIMGNSPSKIPIKVPKTHVKLGLRYISQKNKMDISNLEEYIICKNVENLNFRNADWTVWNTYLNDRSAHIAFVDRMDYTTPGYRLLAFYSENERVIARTTGALKGISKNYAKLITLWFNSSFGFLEWLIWRSPQRFGYCQHHRFTIEELAVPDETILGSSEIDKMMDELKDIEFPSLLEQYVRLLPSNKKGEFTGILDYYQLQDVCAANFEPRVFLDKFIFETLIDNLKKNELLGLMGILVDDFAVSEDIDLINLRNLMKEEEMMSNLISNLHYRIAKTILLSKSAMDNKRSDKFN